MFKPLVCFLVQFSGLIIFKHWYKPLANSILIPPRLHPLCTSLCFPCGILFLATLMNVIRPVLALFWSPPSCIQVHGTLLGHSRDPSLINTAFYEITDQRSQYSLTGGKYGAVVWMCSA